MRFGYNIGYWRQGPPAGALEAVQEAERLGFDSVWTSEAYGSDALTPLAWWGAQTERLQLGTAIMQMSARAATATAMAAITMDHLSNGRFILGLGASGPQVIEGWHGLPYDRPLGRTREVVDIVRAALRRERLVYDGKVFHLPLPEGQGTGLGKPLKMLTKPERSSVPVYVAALGQKNVEGTAEYADGWLPFMFAPERASQVWGEALARGTAKRQEGLGPLEVVAGGMVTVGDDVKGMLDLARPMLALYIGGMGAKGKNFYNTLACEYGFEKEAAQIQDMYLGGNKRDAESVVPLELLEMCNLVGPESYVKERIAAFREAGVTNLQVLPAPVDGDAARLVSRLKEWV
jgi:F420-dependent oxidoreductase-like protein